MNKKVLLIGRNPTVLASLAQALTEAGYSVQTTSFVEQASQEFTAADFDLIAFGRGVDELTNTRLRASFLVQNPAVLLVDGLAPVTSLLVKQIKMALSEKSDTKKAITEFTCQHKGSFYLTIHTSIACQLVVDFYQLDAVHHTQQKTLISEFVANGSHTFLIADLPDLKSTINFLVAEVPDLDLAVVAL